MLGELCAVDNTLGCVGIAPSVDSVLLVTLVLRSTRPDAILAALEVMDLGDLLLIEAQVWANPSTTNNRARRSLRPRRPLLVLL